VAHRERPHKPEAGRRGDGERAELKRRVAPDGTDAGPGQRAHRNDAERERRGHDLGDAEHRGHDQPDNPGPH